MQVAFVLWNGTLGGAETLSGYLAAELRQRGVDARVVFITNGDPLTARLTELSVPWAALNFQRGRAVLHKPRVYARTVRDHGRDGAILMRAGYLATALRLGGYKGRIVAVEHGDMLRKLQTWDRAISARAIDVEVGVSEFMLAEMQGQPHARELLCIPNGIPVDRFRPSRPLNNASAALRVGWAGRLVSGKGVEHLLEAARLLLATTHTVYIKIAGDGPQCAELRELSEQLGLTERVDFIGPTQDMPSFWNSCDLAVAASSADLLESFGMAPLEAAACGRPAVVSRNGALVEVVTDGQTGTIVRPDDPRSLADAIGQYAGDRQMLAAHGQAARDRAVREFSMARCASDYLAAVAK